MIFDWYQAGVEHRPEIVMGALSDHFGAADVEPDKPANGYEQAAKITRGHAVLARVQWGGNTGHRVQVKATGSDAPSLASLCRTRWSQDHVIQRVDVAEDYDESKCFDILTGTALALADRYQLKTNYLGDWHRGQARSLYVGSRQSPVMLRIYEKGHQLRQEGIDRNASLDRVRVEYEFKPKREKARRLYAFIGPEEMIGGSQWTRDLARCIHDLDLEPITGLGTIKRASDRDRSLAFMVKQYANLLESLRDELGSSAAVGDRLLALVDELREAQARG
jgi:hypothetical protein